MDIENTEPVKLENKVISIIGSLKQSFCLIAPHALLTRAG